VGEQWVVILNEKSTVRGLMLTDYTDFY